MAFECKYQMYLVIQIIALVLIFFFSFFFFHKRKKKKKDFIENQNNRNLLLNQTSKRKEYVGCLEIAELVLMWYFYLVDIYFIGPTHHIVGIAYSAIAADMLPLAAHVELIIR